MTPELKEWFDRGGVGSTLQAQEIGDLNRLGMFLKLREQKGTAVEIPAKVWAGYWKGVRTITDMRESILRYANNLEYLRQMRKNKDGMPDNMGASIPEEIRGLSDIRDRAFWLSNDLLGAYDRVSVGGQALREHLVPFWSWKAVNFQRYIQLYKNAAADGNVTRAIGRKAVAFSLNPVRAARVGAFMLKATAFWSFLQAWNHLAFPEEEAELDNDTKSRPHIILGRDSEGKIINFTRIGALGDFLEWFGLDAAPRHVDDWFSGKKTLKEIAIEMAKSPVNVVAQGATPFIKTPAELVTRRSLFPDIFNPRTVRNRGLHLAQSLGLENEYKAIAGLPSEAFSKSLVKTVLYKSDPLQNAYRDILDEKNRFRKKLGKTAEGFWLTPKGDALYNFKLALRYKDKKAQTKYYLEYVRWGGTEDGLKSSIQSMNPLSGLSVNEQNVFVASLNTEDREKLAKAFRFYVEALDGK